MLCNYFGMIACFVLLSLPGKEEPITSGKQFPRGKVDPWGFDAIFATL